MSEKPNSLPIDYPRKLIIEEVTQLSQMSGLGLNEREIEEFAELVESLAQFPTPKNPDGSLKQAIITVSRIFAAQQQDKMTEVLIELFGLSD